MSKGLAPQSLHAVHALPCMKQWFRLQRNMLKGFYSYSAAITRSAKPIFQIKSVSEKYSGPHFLQAHEFLVSGRENVIP